MHNQINISHWHSLPWHSTGGTRDKKYLFNPDDSKTYYFKKSADKFPLEFWSEVIAYELGKQIGLNVLKYDVAIFENEIGCISKSMINIDEEELIEGGKYLQAFDPTFSPDDKTLRHQYKFKLIESALKSFDLEIYIHNILEVIVFDALIGNVDRHQENWAFIGKYTRLAKSVNEMQGAFNTIEHFKYPKWLKKILSYLTEIKNDKTQFIPEVNKIKLHLTPNIKFAPIYDSGSSLCRECTSDKIESMTLNQSELESYLNKGTAEIYWNSDKKLTHFNLITQILDTPHKDALIKIIKKITQKYDENSFRNALQNIDNEVPGDFKHIKIPQNRKDVIIKLVSLRSQKLGELIK